MFILYCMLMYFIVSYFISLYLSFFYRLASWTRWLARLPGLPFIISEISLRCQYPSALPTPQYHSSAGMHLAGMSDRVWLVGPMGGQTDGVFLCILLHVTILSYFTAFWDSLFHFTNMMLYLLSFSCY